MEYLVTFSPLGNWLVVAMSVALATGQLPNVVVYVSMYVRVGRAAGRLELYPSAAGELATSRLHHITTRPCRSLQQDRDATKAKKPQTDEFLNRNRPREQEL
jgi:hypothetical protein